MVSPSDQSDSKNSIKYMTKKCPHCYVYLALSASECYICKAKVGDVDRIGFAEKPVNWRAYVVAGIAFLVFVVFMWWGFIFVE
jgi:hypothetical protein